jgi:hypothetical protein
MVDLIWLDKFGDDDDNDTSKWKYYRSSSRGEDQDPIEVALVTFPSLEDIDFVGDVLSARVTTPGETGMATAWDRVGRVLHNKWGIERERSILIGIRVR